MGNIMINGIKTRIEEYVRRVTSHFPSTLPASSWNYDVEAQPSQSPQARPPPNSPEPPSGVRESLMNLCFVAAIEITIQYKQVAESEISGYIHLLALAIAIIFACLFTSHFIGKKIPKASRMLEKAAFFLAATTFFSAIATPLHQFSSSHSLWPPHPLLPIWSHHDRHSLPRQPRVYAHRATYALD
ncbi:IMAP FAMILY MEMBER 1 putative-RELATED [Salix purpurea]|uniref:IMAP FAMILY MEMBER 1 putative-RELATED n=1 Tax=Salix purpurea TaxID=77065 RepID=A0A9Q0TAD9_SALPP|nr:IMAP FAMILY MEMBER 1 putative-RELATED [Salix purpurea]